MLSESKPFILNSVVGFLKNLFEYVFKSFRGPIELWPTKLVLFSEQSLR